MSEEFIELTGLPNTSSNEKSLFKFFLPELLDG